MITTNKYSEKEMAMIQSISPYWAKLITENKIDLCPPTVLEILAREAFLEDMKGPAVDSLRRCLNALNKGKIYRMTPEFDNLIQL